MDRAFSLPAPPADVWPWFLQLGKRRAGWYLSRRMKDGTRVQLRLRLSPVRHRRLATSLGGFVDWASVAGPAVGLRERLTDRGPARHAQRP